MQPQRHLPFQTTAGHALKQCAPKKFARFMQRVRPITLDAGAPSLPRVEQLWFPFYLFTFEVASVKGVGEIPVCIDGWSGSFALFELGGLLTDGAPEGEYIPPFIGQEEAERLARKDLLDTIMRQRSAHGPKPAPGKVLHHEIIAYPFWIYYFYRRTGLIDIKICDGAVGDLFGLRTRAGVLNAFKARSSHAGAGE